MVVVGGGTAPRVAVDGGVVDVCVVDYGTLDRRPPAEHTSDLLHATLAWTTREPEAAAIGALQDEIVGEFRAAGLDV